MRPSRGAILLVSSILLLTAGCADLQKPKVTTPKQAVKLPTRVAILPFYLDVKPPADPLQQEAVQILREQFFNRFADLSYLDLDLAEVDRRLHAAGISDDEAALATDPQRLATLLGVDGLLVGRISEVSSFRGAIITDARLGGTVKLINSLGQTAWEVEHTESRQGGLLLKGGELVRALEDLQSQYKDDKHLTYLKLSEEFSRKVVSNIKQPDMAQAISFAAPQIKRVTVQVATGRTLQQGDIIQATVESGPGLSGTLDLGFWRRGIPLVEISPGRYVGAYSVKAGDAAQAVPVAVRLSDAFGLAASYEVKDLTLEVDAAPPAPPADVVAEASSGPGVVVRWSQSAGASGFAVYRSCPAGAELELLANVTGGTSYQDPSGDPSAGACSYQVAAFDALKNLSYPTVAERR